MQSTLPLVRRAVPGLLAAGALAGAAHLRNRFEQSQTFFPERFPNGIWDPTPFGLAASDHWFESKDGIRLHGWWMPHRRNKGTFLYCHGNSGNLTSQIGAYRTLQRFGWNVFAFDYRGYGRSEGTPSEQGLFGDVRAAYRTLRDELGQEPERVVLYGHSLGGAVAIDAALDCPVAGLIVQASLTNTRDVARNRFGALPLHWISSPKFRSIDKVEHIECPKFFLHGTEDATIPHALGEALYEAAAEPKQWASIARAGHLDVHRLGGLRLHLALSRFLRAAIAQARSGLSPS